MRAPVVFELVLGRAAADEILTAAHFLCSSSARVDIPTRSKIEARPAADFYTVHMTCRADMGCKPRARDECESDGLRECFARAIRNEKSCERAIAI